jgi:hypothetical protein
MGYNRIGTAAFRFMLVNVYQRKNKIISGNLIRLFDQTLRIPALFSTPPRGNFISF